MEREEKKRYGEEERVGEVAGQVGMGFADGFNYLSHMIYFVLYY